MKRGCFRKNTKKQENIALQVSSHSLKTNYSRLKIFCCASLLCIICSSCDYHIRQYGYVLDRKTGKPITDCRITLNSEALELDSNGFFRKDGLTVRYKSKLLSVEKDGYKPFNVDIDDMGEDDANYRVSQKFRIVESEHDWVKDSTTYRVNKSERVNDYSSKFSVSGDTIWIYLEQLK